MAWKSRQGLPKGTSEGSPVSRPEFYQPITWPGMFPARALLSVWASLRFGDASHIRWSSLLYDVSCHVLRGVAYRTKTTRRGMPFACQGRGIYGYWAATWLRSLDSLWLYLEDAGLCIDPDSLFFVTDAPGFGAGSLDLAFAPASYASALRSLRQALSLWGHLSPAAVANYTLHASKAKRLCFGPHSSGSKSS